ncbi:MULTISPECIES: hypothetical protein [Streptococcus]|uniref:Secreted protein n=1 Tax=Streptococcus dysgalactiae subsp. equisimilis TaxID=119602 RepID=A0A9X8T115_STREQ|nr:MULTISPECIES: hypothetical protein [Streptococcus]EPT37508.1 hypothetical protein SAG0029_00460 [Streptococcus agalactiae FSL S3-501]SQF68009.1 Uncharacterised protein [Streptococcus dysgalactiae subsp. equisimilis]VEF04926.1 Uncharacterised protein [Streptococcus dysgalactiae subsp. equisimilis]VTS27885.1 Uncharacterised protein [Streptococcus dysgalactiae subsp. equisimilis]VTS37047.1 Uncharacterised protein [Streptococcus dysgalactiae subsp. equisimilis]
MKFKKYISLGLVSLSLGSVLLPSFSSVVTAEAVTVIDSQHKVSKDGVRLFLIDGKIFELPVDSPDPTPEQIIAMKQQRGKWSAAVKAIRKGYSKVPPKVKGYINKFIGLEAILGTIDHFTGWIEDGIYQACKNAGMPDWMAWTVAKALTLIAL